MSCGLHSLELGWYKSWYMKELSLGSSHWALDATSGLQTLRMDFPSSCYITCCLRVSNRDLPQKSEELNNENMANIPTRLLTGFRKRPGAEQKNSVGICRRPWRASRSRLDFPVRGGQILETRWHLMGPKWCRLPAVPQSRTVGLAALRLPSSMMSLLRFAVTAIYVICQGSEAKKKPCPGVQGTRKL